jgi:hypothetical protein
MTRRLIVLAMAFAGCAGPPPYPPKPPAPPVPPAPDVLAEARETFERTCGEFRNVARDAVQHALIETDLNVGWLDSELMQIFALSGVAPEDPRPEDCRDLRDVIAAGRLSGAALRSFADRRGARGFGAARLERVRLAARWAALRRVLHETAPEPIVADGAWIAVVDSATSVDLMPVVDSRDGKLRASISMQLFVAVPAGGPAKVSVDSLEAKVEGLPEPLRVEELRVTSIDDHYRHGRAPVEAAGSVRLFIGGQSAHAVPVESVDFERRPPAEVFLILQLNGTRIRVRGGRIPVCVTG